VIVLDTVALFYWTIDPVKLSTSARKTIDKAERLIISSISVWEIAQKVKKSRLEIRPGIEEYVAGLYRLERLEILSVDSETWLNSVLLDWPHRDPADRVIVATATRLNCPLVTSDRVISDFYTATIW
jgi:PIN domain nuclease of toxin-antitoxin system